MKDKKRYYLIVFPNLLLTLERLKVRGSCLNFSLHPLKFIIYPFVGVVGVLFQFAFIERCLDGRGAR